MTTTRDTYKVIKDGVAEDYKLYLKTGNEDFYQRALDHGSQLQKSLLKKAHDEAVSSVSVSAQPEKRPTSRFPGFLKLLGSKKK
ncbi:MAG: hypothetical protein F6K14_19920 [Symploca sp. SIO2C1]|nr:hypothetical protein [Symploca sp. SIO2C1]